MKRLRNCFIQQNVVVVETIVCLADTNQIKYKCYHPELPVFLILLESDSFGKTRWKYGNEIGMDSLDLIFCSRAMKGCRDILEEYLSWMRSTEKTMTILGLQQTNHLASRKDDFR